MPGGHELGLHAVGIVEQPAEFEPGVADDAGIGRASRGVLRHEIVDDPAELVLEIQGIKRNIQPVGHPAGVFGVGGRAAALLVCGSLDDRQNGLPRGSRGSRIAFGDAVDRDCVGCGRTTCRGRAVAGSGAGRGLAMAHEDADHVVSGGAQQLGGDTAVDPSGHG